MTKRRDSKRGLLYLILLGLIALILVGGLIALRPAGSPLSLGIRGAALLGYLAIFLASLSSIYMRQMYQFFGRPFVKVHHTLSVTGLIMMTLHPLGVALQSANLRVFLPRFDSMRVFLELGGRPAWYLIGAASLAAVLRKSIGQNWRAIHVLNYIAFLLATVHAVLIGTDFLSPVMKGVGVVMALVVIGAFIQKRLQKRNRSK